MTEQGRQLGMGDDRAGTTASVIGNGLTSRALIVQSTKRCASAQETSHEEQGVRSVGYSADDKTSARSRHLCKPSLVFDLVTRP